MATLKKEWRVDRRYYGNREWTRGTMMFSSFAEAIEKTASALSERENEIVDVKYVAVFTPATEFVLTNQYNQTTACTPAQ